MSNYDFEQEAKKSPQCHWGKIWEFERNGVKFLLERALMYVEDDVCNGSVELSHYENLGYAIVTNFDYGSSTSNSIPDTLDFTWMLPDTIFRLNRSEQYNTIKTIIVNVDNLPWSRLPENERDEPEIKPYDPIDLVINHGKTKMSFRKQVSTIVSFMSYYESRIKKVKLIGYTPFEEKIISFFARRKGLDIIEFEEKESPKTLKKTH